MRCPVCRGPAIVLEVRYCNPSRTRKRRRRQCTDEECGYRFTTLELEDGPLLRDFLKGRLVPQSPRLQRRLDVERRDRSTTSRSRLLPHPLNE